MRIALAIATAGLLLGLASPARAKPDMPMSSGTPSRAVLGQYSCLGAPAADFCIGPVRVKVTQSGSAPWTTKVIVYYGDERVDAVQLDAGNRQAHIGRSIRLEVAYVDMDVTLAESAAAPTLSANLLIVIGSAHTPYAEYDGWIWSP